MRRCLTICAVLLCAIAAWGMTRRQFEELMVVATRPVAALAPATPTNGLVGYWPFDGDILDYSGLGNNCTNFEPTGVRPTNGVKGLPNTAYYFNGDAPQALGFRAITLTNNLSISMWLRPYAANKFFAGGSGSSHGYLYLQATNSLSLSNDGETKFHYYSVIPPFQLLTWDHFAFSMTNGATAFYRNGTLVTNYSYAAPFVVTWIRFGFGYSGYYYGSIDNPRIYNRDLSSNEVKQIYDFEKP